MNAYCINKKLFLFFFFVSITFASAYAHADDEIIIYVDVDKHRNIDFFEVETYGTSWETAFKSLHDALRFGDPNATQIWIAAGNYYLDKGSTLLIEAGTATGAPTKDIIGATRPAIPSLGAYEGAPVLRIGRTKKLEDSLEIYPNPVVKGSTLYINNPNALTLHTIEIHDLTGRLVKTVALEDRSTHITIDISSLANATYTVRIPNEHGNISKKIIINN